MQLLAHFQNVLYVELMSEAAVATHWIEVLKNPKKWKNPKKSVEMVRLQDFYTKIS